MARYDPVVFAKMLKELRGGISQDALARLSGVPRSVIERLEVAETRKAGFEDVVLLCQALEVDVNDLAAALGLLPAPGEAQYSPAVARTIVAVREVMSRLAEEEQEELEAELTKTIGFFEFGLKTQKAKEARKQRKKKKNEEGNEKRSIFPEWWWKKRQDMEPEGA